MSNPVQSVDLRPVFDRWGLDVRRQGERGTCSVFTMTDALEYALAVRWGASTRLSVEFLNWACHQELGKPQDGGFFSDLWTGFLAHGICPQVDMAYEAAFDSARQPGAEAITHAQALSRAGLRLHWIKPWDPNIGVNDEQLAQIKRVLSERWPVAGGFLWPKEEKSVDGVLVMPGRDAVRDGHSVLLVGFRDDPAQAGGGVLIFRNTSKTHPGGSMTYAYAQAYMNDAVWIDCDADRP